MTSNSSGPWSPYGTTTYSTLSTSETPMSPSRYSYSSRPDSQIQSSDSEDTSSGTQMRRITVSPSPSNGLASRSETNPYSYDDDRSFEEEDADEVEAALNDLENDLDETEELWSRSGSYTATPSGTYSSYSGSGSYAPTSASMALPPSGTFPRARHIPDPQIRLSVIEERTENSRPSSGAISTTQFSRPANPTPEGLRRSLASLHTRSSTDPTGDRELPPPGRAIELIARFETNSPAGHSRIASAPGGPRSPAPYLNPSQSTPNLLSTTGYSTSYGYGSTYGYSSRSPSPTKSRASSSLSSSASEERITTTLSDLMSHRPTTSMSEDSHFYSSNTGTRTEPRSATNTFLSPGTYTDTFTNTMSATGTTTPTGTYTATTPTASLLRRPQQTSPRSPLASVRNIVAAWKERTPTLGRSTGKASTVTSTSSISPPPGDGDGLFGIRRRAQRVGQRLRETGLSVRGGQASPRDTAETTPSARSSTGLPPGLDISDFSPYTQTNEQPQHIGLLWYLNVHTSPPYRWQRCQALLYPHMLLLSWLAPGGGRGIVAIDLLNCTSVQSVPSPTHPSARDDVGTVAAQLQSSERDGQPLMSMLVPFHMIYADGVERLAAESLHERSKWVHRLWEVVNPRAASPDPSLTRSPTGSIRTILSMETTSSSTSAGSRSTVFVPPMSSLPDISDDLSVSSKGGVKRQASLVSTHYTGTQDDTAISRQQYVYRGDPRVITASRGNSLRRTSSLTDLDEAFASALDRARGARPGLGFASRVILGGSPVTVSSGSSLGGDVFVTPPPSAGRGRDRSGTASELSDEAFFSAGSGSGSEIRSSLYSLTSTGRDRTTTSGLLTDETRIGFTSGGSATQVVPSTLSYRGTDSASYLGDSHDSSSYTSTSPRTPLSRAREVRRRHARTSSRSFSSSYQYSDDSSDKENSGSYTPSGSGSYTPPRTRSSDETGYDICRSSDMSAFTLNSYSTYSYTETRSESSSVPPSSTPSNVFVSASEGSDAYVTATSPSSTAFESLPTIPSESGYNTAEEGSVYATASEPSDYVTAEKCPTEASTEYHTAFEPKDIPSEPATPRAPSVRIELTEEEEVSTETESVGKTPSVVPSIITTSDVEDLVDPVNIPLPPSLPPSSPSISSRSVDTFSAEESVTKSPTTVPTPSSVSFSPLPSESSVSGPSPIGTEPPSTPLLPLSTVSSLSLSSPSATPSDLTPSSPIMPASPMPSSPSVWAAETSDSYESSILGPSPSIATIALHEGPDFSFDTSFLRPSGSPISSLDRMTTIPETPSVLTPMHTLPPFVPVPAPASPPLPPIPVESDESPSTAPTPSDIEFSTTEESSSVTTSLTTSSLSSSYVSESSDSSSIPISAEPLPVPGPQSPMSDPSTQPSLLSTPRPTSVPRSISPISLASTPVLSTPDATFSVSVTTPRGDVPSIHSIDSMRTPTASVRPERDLTRDIHRLAEDLHRMDQTRADENEELTGHVRALREELHDLSEYLRRTPSPILQADRTDKKVGGSSILSGPRGPRELVVPTPPSSLSRTGSIASSMVSYLSSHHSDDYSLLGSPYPGERDLELLPEWEETSSPITTSSSELSSSSPYSSSSKSLPITPSSVSSATPTPPTPSQSPSPTNTSSSSASTVRPRLTLPNLQPALDNLRDYLGDMWNNRLAEVLEEIKNQRPRTPDNMELLERIGRIETLLRPLLDQPRAQPEGPPDGSQPASDSESISSGSFRDYLNRLNVHPSIQMPIPTTAGPSLAQQLEDILSSGLNMAAPHVQPPPPLIPFTYQPVGARPRSTSPDSLRELLRRRADTEPPFPRDYPDWPPRRPRVRRHGQARQPSQPVSDHPVIPAPAPSSTEPPTTAPPPRPPVPPVRPVDLDLHDRAGTAPPDLGGDQPRDSETWYRQSRDQAPGAGIPPPPIMGPGAARQPRREYLPMPAGPTVIQLPPGFENLAEILRENRLAQLATVDQQRELMRYMRGLNEWLERDVHDRQAELRGVSARVEQLSNYVRNLGDGMGRRPGGPPSSSSGSSSSEDAAPGFPQPMLGMPQPQIGPGFPPPGFVPGQGTAPVIPPLFPDRTPPGRYAPVIPDLPGPIVVNQPGPVIPNLSGYPLGGPGPMPMQPTMGPQGRIFIPPSRTPSPGGTVHYVPPPVQGQGPNIIRVDASDASSSVTSSDRRSRRSRRSGSRRRRSRSRTRSRSSRSSSRSSRSPSPTPMVVQSQQPIPQVFPGPSHVSVPAGGPPPIVEIHPSAPSVAPMGPRHPDLAPPQQQQQPTTVINIPPQGQATMGPGGMMVTGPGMIPPMFPPQQQPTFVRVDSRSRSSRSSSRSRRSRRRSSSDRRHRRSRSPPSVHLHERSRSHSPRQQPGVTIVPSGPMPPGTMPMGPMPPGTMMPMGPPPQQLYVAQPSRSSRSRSRSSRSRSRSPPPQQIILPPGQQPTQVPIMQPPTAMYPPPQPSYATPAGPIPMVYPGQAQGTQPMVVVRSGSRSRSRSRSHSRSPRRSQPIIVPTGAPPTQVPIIMPTGGTHASRRSRSRSRSPRFEIAPSAYSRRRSRSRSRSPARTQAPPPVLVMDPSASVRPPRSYADRPDSPRRRPHDYGDRPDSPRRRPQDYGDRPDSPRRRPQDYGDRPDSPRRRRRRSRSYSPDSRYRYEREREPHRRRRGRYTRSRSPYSRSRSRSLSPREGGRRRRHSRDRSPYRRSRSPRDRQSRSRGGRSPSPRDTRRRSRSYTPEDASRRLHGEPVRTVRTASPLPHPGPTYADTQAPPHVVTVPTLAPGALHSIERPLTRLSMGPEPDVYGNVPGVSRTRTARTAPSREYSPAPSVYEPPNEGYHQPEVLHRLPPGAPATVPHTIPSEHAVHLRPGDERSLADEGAPSGRPVSMVPIPVPHRPITPFPGDLDGAALVREHADRLRDMENQLQEITHDAQRAEEQREHEFRDHEEDRERIFLDNQARRDQEARERHDEIWQDLEHRLATVAGPSGPPPAQSPDGSPVLVTVPSETRPTSEHVSGDATSIHESIRESAASAGRNVAESYVAPFMEELRAEREEHARQMSEAQAERDRLFNELQAEKNQALVDRDNRIAALEEELSNLRGELENEKAQRITQETETRERERQEAAERDEGLRTQLGNIADLLNVQRDECEGAKTLAEERWNEQLGRQQDKEFKWIELRDMVQKIHDDLETDRQRAEDARLAAESKPGNDKILEELQRQNAEQRELLNQIADSWRAECLQHHEETLRAVRETAHEQVPFNVQGYLDDFSKSLATEVRMLLGEVGNLRDTRRALHHEIGFLLSTKAKYGPGGEFEPDWTPPAPAGPAAAEPTPEPPVPPEVPQARPGWRTIPQRRRRREREQAAPTPAQAPPAAGPPPTRRTAAVIDPRRQVESWSGSIWHPNPDLAPTPPSVEANLLIPERSSPGLFGPRSPAGSVAGQY